MKHKFNNTTSFNYNLKHDNNEDKTGILRFIQCDDKYPIYELTKEELKQFISFAKKIENMPWRTIKTYKGFKYENITNIDKPEIIEKDITLSSIRASEKFRIIGYRQQEYFFIIWFDRNHLSYKG